MLDKMIQEEERYALDLQGLDPESCGEQWERVKILRRYKKILEVIDECDSDSAVGCCEAICKIKEVLK